MVKKHPKIITASDHYNIDGKRYSRVTSIISHFSGDYSGIDPEVLAEAARRGTMAHTVMGHYLNKRVKQEAITADFLSKYHAKTFSKWQNARHWLQDNVAYVEDTERTVWHEELGYAGTLDAIIQIKTAQPYRVIMDLKTGTARPVEHRLQLGAYYAALPANEVDNIDGGILLYAGEKKCKIVELSDREIKAAADDFRALARTFQLFGGVK